MFLCVEVARMSLTSAISCVLNLQRGQRQRKRKIVAIKAPAMSNTFELIKTTKKGSSIKVGTITCTALNKPKTKAKILFLPVRSSIFAMSRMNPYEDIELRKEVRKKIIN